MGRKNHDLCLFVKCEIMPTLPSLAVRTQSFTNPVALLLCVPG